MAAGQSGRSVIRFSGRLALAAVTALSLGWGSAGVREAAAGAGDGCVIINSIEPSQGPSVTIPPMFFQEGDIISVTASDPSTGSPTLVRIGVGLPPSTLVVAEVAFPGTASYTIPSTDNLDWLVFSVDQGDATLALSCTCIDAETATPTETATAVATETATATPTETAIATATSTPVPAITETALPTSIATETAIPTIVVPTSVPAATSTTVPDPTDEAAAVTELPDTGAGPDGGSTSLATWLLLSLGAVSLVGLRFRKLQQIDRRRR